MDPNYSAYQQNQQQPPNLNRFGNGAASGGTPMGIMQQRMQAGLHEGNFSPSLSPLFCITCRI
jgi:hypothetical protein